MLGNAYVHVNKKQIKKQKHECYNFFLIYQYCVVRSECKHFFVVDILDFFLNKLLKGQKKKILLISIMSLFHPKKVWELGISPPDISNEF